MKNSIYLLCLLTSVFSCCSKQGINNEHDLDAQEGVTTYFLPKGNHSAEGNRFGILLSGELKCEVLFDSSAVYQSVKSENQGDVNKLIGFSDCNDHHQENSARIGWSWNGKSVVLYAYAYINKERIIKTLSTVSLNQWVKCSVKASGDSYYFTTGNYTDSLKRHCIEYSGSRYQLYPYFGGDETAPHDITIRIRNGKW